MSNEERSSGDDSIWQRPDGNRAETPRGEGTWGVANERTNDDAQQALSSPRYPGDTQSSNGNAANGYSQPGYDHASYRQANYQNNAYAQATYRQSAYSQATYSAEYSAAPTGTGVRTPGGGSKKKAIWIVLGAISAGVLLIVGLLWGLGVFAGGKAPDSAPSALAPTSPTTQPQHPSPRASAGTSSPPAPAPTVPSIDNYLAELPKETAGYAQDPENQGIYRVKGEEHQPLSQLMVLKFPTFGQSELKGEEVSPGVFCSEEGCDFIVDKYQYAIVGFGSDADEQQLAIELSTALKAG